VVSDSRYASGRLILREPLWDLVDRDPFPRIPEESASPRGVPEMPGGRDRAGSGFPRDDSGGGGSPQMVIHYVTRVRFGTSSPPEATSESARVGDCPQEPKDCPLIGPACEPSRAEEIFSLDPPPSGTDTPFLATLVYGRSLGPPTGACAGSGRLSRRPGFREVL
jgi:hypothetical protein